jgi:aconitate hydratase
VPKENLKKSITAEIDGKTIQLKHGSLLIAAITSCTNTSNPSVMLSAGLLAKHAVERGLSVSPAVKCSLNPGSTVVTSYLEAAGLLEPLAQLGFAVSGYGCASCIGNAGPLREELTVPAAENGLIMTSVSSANRNFEGRISPHTRANYLASPPLVVAYALAGRMDIDLTTQPIGTDKNGKDVFLSDIFPSSAEIETLFSAVSPEMFRASYADIFEGDQRWNALSSESNALYSWEAHSTYIQEPPYFTLFNEEKQHQASVDGARALLKLGDSITTDHISPAGVIARNGDAAQYLEEHDIAPWYFNSFGSRRGNDRVMVRGTFANVRIKNQLAPGTEGGFTRYLPTGETMTVYQAAQKYKVDDTPLLVLAGKEYGTGSSRDWAAKGPLLLGVRAILAESFERIHRSNLVGMGILPLQYLAGENADSLGLTGEESFSLQGLDAMQPGGMVTVVADGVKFFNVKVRIDTPAELDMYRAGGILLEAVG